MAEDSNKVVIDEIINPTPGLIEHDTVNVDSQSLTLKKMI